MKYTQINAPERRPETGRAEKGSDSKPRSCRASEPCCDGTTDALEDKASSVREASVLGSDPTATVVSWVSSGRREHGASKPAAGSAVGGKEDSRTSGAASGGTLADPLGSTPARVGSRLGLGDAGRRDERGPRPPHGKCAAKSRAGATRFVPGMAGNVAVGTHRNGRSKASAAPNNRVVEGRRDQLYYRLASWE